ncbi:MAG: hypothetical protein M1503_07390 [Thaumarchaeota archaeon]|nr:hypothetical protein [Nitrososphaerota archaeon]
MKLFRSIWAAVVWSLKAKVLSGFANNKMIVKTTRDDFAEDKMMSFREK